MRCNGVFKIIFIKENYMRKTVFGLLGMVLLLSCSSNERNSAEFKISMEGNPTAGYSWKCSAAPEGIVSIKEKIVYLGDSGVQGAPLRFDYTLKAKKDGKTKVTFVYKRSSEDEKPVDEIVYDVEVKDKNIYVQGDFCGTWQIKSFSENDIAQSMCDVELIIKENSGMYSLHGSAGVNIFNTRMNVDGNKGVLPDNFALTRMMGPEAAMEFERLYTTLLCGEVIVSTANHNGADMLIIENPAKGLKAIYSRKTDTEN